MEIPSLRAGETNRATREELFFGGKGINVSCILRELRCETVALGFVAGFTGDALAAHLGALGISTAFIRLPAGLTRINVKLKGDCETEINADGPAVPPVCLHALLDRLDAIPAGDTLVLAGSVPSSLPQDLYRIICERLAGRGIRLAVDASGDALVAVLPAKPFVIKPNLAELEDVTRRMGLSSGSDASLIDASGQPNDVAIRKATAALQAAGARNVLVSLGGDGALLLDEQGAYHRGTAVGIPPVGRPLNTVGAGDSMLAGFLCGVDEGRGYAHALRLALAAGGATAMSPGLASRDEIFSLMP